MSKRSEQPARTGRRTTRARHLAASAAIVIGTVVVAALALVLVPAESGPVPAAGADPAVVQSGQSHANYVSGPASFSASFARATRAGDLLVVGVICGVFTDGETNATLALPAGWRTGVDEIGGHEGGNEAAEFYYPDNPGGITTFAVGSIPRGTEADCTTFWTELAVVGASVGVDTTGTGTSLGGESDTVLTDAVVPAGDLVLLAETDGTTVADNQYTLPAGFAFLGQENDDVNDSNQPGVLAELVAGGGRREGGTVSWNGGWTDSATCIMALHLSTSTTTTTTTAATPTGFRIAQSSLPRGTAGDSYSTTLTATGGHAPYTWELVRGAGRLPHGLRLHRATGMISGRIARRGFGTSFEVRVLSKRVEGNRYAVTKAFSIAVSRP